MNGGEISNKTNFRAISHYHKIVGIIKDRTYNIMQLVLCHGATCEVDRAAYA